MSQWDVVVVGGGPAGAATATYLARRSHSVLLLDRSPFPRDKPCGECVSPGAVAELAAMGTLDQVRAAAGSRLVGWKIHAPDGEFFTGDFAPGQEGLAIRRSVLDAILLERAREAGVEIRTGQRVTDLVWHGDAVAGVRVGRAGEIRARLVVGADGLRSVVLRRLKLIRRPPRLRKLALTAHVRGVQGLGEHGELHVRRWGCIGVAAVGGGMANVTVVLGDGRGGAVGGDREAFFDRATAAEPRLSGAVREGEVFATGPFDWSIQRAIGNGAMLVGDAAGYYDPFTGQGIYRALTGAAMAAEIAGAALRTDDLSKAALMPYERARLRSFAPGERLQRLIEAVVARPKLMNLAARQLKMRRAAADALVAVAGDVQPVRSLFRPGLVVP